MPSDNSTVTSKSGRRLLSEYFRESYGESAGGVKKCGLDGKGVEFSYQYLYL